MTYSINIIKESHVVGEKYSSLYSLSVLQKIHGGLPKCKVHSVHVCETLFNQIKLTNSPGCSKRSDPKACLHHDFAPSPRKKRKIIVKASTGFL